RPLSHFSIHLTDHHPDLHSFPTRRSSDLRAMRILSRAEKGPRRPPKNSALNFFGTARPSLIRQNKMKLLRRGSPAGQTSSPLRSDRKSTRLNSSHLGISYAVFCLKKKKHA